MSSFAGVVAVLRQASRDRAFPAAVMEVGRSGGVLWRQAIGALTWHPAADPARADTIFDLASLTKVLSTATLAMRAVDEGRLSLEEPVADRLRAWQGRDRAQVTIRHLLDHSAGLTAWLPLYRDCTGRAEFEAAICRLPLEYEPGTRSVYSDLGFILLGFILEEACPGGSGGGAGSVDPSCRQAAQFGRIASLLTPAPLTFNPPRAWRPRCAPTEFDAWRGRLLVGEVHDENAWALGGAAGHAGLFGTADAVGAFARAVLRTLAGDRLLAAPGTMRRFAARTGVPGSSRALGWDTMLPTSSCGTRLSPGAIGHTGFTGTSLWIDWERDLYVVVLTNRVHPTRDNERLRAVRPRLHDAVVAALEDAAAAPPA